MVFLRYVDVLRNTAGEIAIALATWPFGERNETTTISNALFRVRQNSEMEVAASSRKLGRMLTTHKFAQQIVMHGQRFPPTMVQTKRSGRLTCLNVRKAGVQLGLSKRLLPNHRKPVLECGNGGDNRSSKYSREFILRPQVTPA
jgi:hypothetical protein